MELASVWRQLGGMGAWGLILLGIADNTPFVSAPPGSMDLALILLSAHHHELWFYYAFTASVGEVFGGYLTYRVSQKSGMELVEKTIGNIRAAKLYKLFDRHSFTTVLMGAILPPPFPFTSVLMTAGAMQYSRKEFLCALTLGRTSRFVAEAYLARRYGQRVIVFFSRQSHAALPTIATLFAIAGITALVWFRYRRRHQKQNTKLPARRLRNSEPTGMSTDEE